MSITCTLIVLAYQQEAFVGQAVESALAQNYVGPLEILISDDGSTDATWEIIRDLAGRYAGPHIVTLNRIKQNAGIIGHFTSVVKKARGDIVAYLAGDDVAARDRVACCAALLSTRPELSFVESAYRPFSQVVPEEAAGPKGYVSVSLEDYITGRAPDLSSSTRCFRRRLFLDYPDLDRGLSSEDSTSALRLLMRGEGARLHRTLLFKRVHPTNITGPEGLKKIDFDLIGTQYLRDAEFARINGFVNQEQFRQLQNWVPRHIKRRKLRLLFDLDYPSTNEIWRKIIFSRVLRPREKVFALRRWVRGMVAPNRASR